MKVTVTSIEEFFECLDAEKQIYQGTIRVCTGKKPLDPPGRIQVKFEIILQACTLVEVEEGGQYLLQIGISCGKDYEDQGGERPGSALAKSYRDRIAEYARKRAWRVLPGVIEE
jgi:hypothetical protein